MNGDIGRFVTRPGKNERHRSKPDGSILSYRKRTTKPR